MIIRRLALVNWKNFSSLDVKLSERAFLVGPNASGKSNFLDAVRFLNDIAKPGGGLENALKARGGFGKIRSLSARKRSNVDVKVFLGSRASEAAQWEYSLSLIQEGRGRHRTLIEHEIVRHKGKVVVDRPDELDRKDDWRLTQTYLEQISSNQMFREIYTFMNSVRYIHLIPQLIRQPELFFNTAIKQEDDAFGFRFLENIVKTPRNTLRSRLSKIERALRVAVPQLTHLSEIQDEMGVPHLEAIYEHWRPGAGKQQESQFSDGTIRLIGLLWSLLENKSVLLLEEPELSLHPGIVKQLPSLFFRLSSMKREDQQVLLSTHSPDFLADKGISAKEILLFIPKKEGTEVSRAYDITDVRALLEGGFTPQEAVIPFTYPQNIQQLDLFK